MPISTCPKCGYDLRATPERCPECGEDIRFLDRQCPDCRLYNPRSAVKCDCGYSFFTGERDTSSSRKSPSTRSSILNWIVLIVVLRVIAALLQAILR